MHEASTRRSMRVAATMLTLLSLTTACSRAAIQPAPVPTAGDAQPAFAMAEPVDQYRAAGFLVGDGAIPFVGMVRFHGTETLDTTAVIVALSIPPRSLSFVRSGDRYSAFLAVRLDVMSGPTLVRSERPSGEIRVASLAETTRGDEGVIFQRVLRLPVGNYTLRVTAQDSLGGSTGTASGPLTVRYVTDGAFAPMIPVFSAEPRSSRAGVLQAALNPRSTVRFGRDSTLRIYIEGYGPTAPDTVVVTTRPAGDSTAALRRDTLVLAPGTQVRARTFSIPVASVGLGMMRLTATTTSGALLGSIPVIVSLGADVPVSSFDELLDALRFYAPEQELLAMRAASPDKRPSLWQAFARVGDPNPATAGNEALSEYFRRVKLADDLYRDGGVPGWRTDRGAVLTALGEPDTVLEPQPDSTNQPRTMSWEYRRHRVVLSFVDQTGFGRWRLTPASDADLRAIVALSGPCVGCRLAGSAFLTNPVIPSYIGRASRVDLPGTP